MATIVEDFTDNPAVKAAFDRYRELQRVVEKELPEAIRELRFTADTKTLKFEGVIYQVRERNGKPYLVELKDEPRTWLKGRPKSDKTLAAERLNETIGSSDEDASESVEDASEESNLTEGEFPSYSEDDVLDDVIG